MAQRVTEKQLANLRPLKPITREEAKRRGRAGGLKSVAVKKEKKLMSQLYGELLAAENNITYVKGKGTGLKEVAIDILSQRQDHGSRVRMLKEIADRTEGASTTRNDDAKKDADLLSALLGKGETE